jgi:hypothetical protein
MAGLVEPLAWDTEFFGFPIGRADLTGADAERLRAVDDEARDLGLVCLYGSIDADHAETAYRAQELGHRLVEIAIKLARPAMPFTPRETTSQVRRGTVDDLPSLGDAIATLAPWSRFGADPRFGLAAANRMFHAWVERAARDGDEYMLLVTEDDTGITGLSTHVRSPIPRVDLMGVLTQGSGAAWALMAGLIEWAHGGAVEAGPCAARNIAPMRYLEHCGFAIVHTRYLLHRWYDDHTVAP